MRLFEYSEQFAQLKNWASELDFNEETGEIISNDSVIEDLFNELQCSLEQKLESTAYVLKELEANEQMLRSEVDRLNKKARALAKNQTMIRELMQYALKASEQDKVKTDKFTFSLRKSSSLEIDELVAPLEFMPKQFVRVKKEFDKTAITKALKAGEIIDGCLLVANETLQIR